MRNIAQLLKDCSKGTKLYSPVCGECELISVSSEDGRISVSSVKFKRAWTFTDEGTYSDYSGECLLFPSEEVRDWDYFGVFWIHGNHQRATEIINILQKYGEGDLEGIVNSCDSDCTLFVNSRTKSVDWIRNDIPEYQIVTQFGTELKLEEEKQPKFQVGDVVVKNDKVVGIVTIVGEKAVGYYNYSNSHKRASISIENLRLATEEEIDRWNKETLHPNHMHYSKNKKDIIENWLLPFDKVIGRKGSNHKWEINLFDHYDIDELSYPAYDRFPYHCLSEKYAYCLPYNEETMKLIGTTNDYKE